MNDKISQLFFSFAANKIAELKRNKIRFAHYTSAEAAMHIIENEEVWMRNAIVMNDFSEIQHGQRCIDEAWRDPLIGGVEGGRLNKIFNNISSGLSDRIYEIFQTASQHRLEHSYLVSISEHGNGQTNEDKYGRLSMWRAYGGNSNVAFVFNNEPFYLESMAYPAYTSPVLYCDATEFKKEFSIILDRFESEIEFLKTLGEQSVIDFTINMLHFAAICTKHPGFSEEKEWRIIHSPSLTPSPRIPSSIQVIKGIPQLVHMLPIKNFPEDGLTGASLNELLDEIIIGPTNSPRPIHEALISKLESKGITNPRKRVRISEIPLRR